MNLQSKYSREEFLSFISSFIPNFGKDIRKVDTRGLKTTTEAHYLGESPDLDLAVFELTHTSSSDARVALSKEGFKILNNHGIYRALIAYYSYDSEDWRLSLLTTTLESDIKGKPKQEFSNPRRYSFFLGPNAKTNTPNRFLIKDGLVKSYDDLLSRFNVEIVTKEFFENYKKLYDRLLAYLNKDHAFQAFAGRNGVETANFAKKLLGQIVFLYFLQRKGWLGAKKGDSISYGDKNFLRSLFIKCVERKTNFYNEYLEKLFYGALNKSPEKAGSYYRNYFDCQIPFLNGGLFEPPQNYDWEGEFLSLPNKLFSKDPNNPNHGDGILDIFDLYNFTVDESDYLDKEVSVDPEMLGKVFENLLEENLRKGKGTYYTPREIVNYMCEESLVNYLATETGLTSNDIKNKYFPTYNVLGDEKIDVRDVTISEQIIESLQNIKVVDPACGSGAFLVGMLQQITQLRHELETRSKFLGRRDNASSEYEIKKQTIQNCIYGVDIDPGAVDIAKLRLWLSLVVDYDLEDIEPLPNLDYKIMQGNSLHEELVLGDTTIKLYDRQSIQKALNSKRMKNLFEADPQMAMFDDIKKEQALKNMKALQVQYFSQSDAGEKKKIKAQIEKIEHDLIEASIKAEVDMLSTQKLNIRALPGVGLLPKDAKRLMNISSKESQIMAVLEELRKSGTKPFFLWHLHFADVFEEKDGFDIVIANPPYIGEKGHKEMFRELRRGSFGQYYVRNMDIFYFFFHLALDLSNNKAAIAFISTNYYFTATGAKRLRYEFKAKATIKHIVNLNNIKIFESAQGQHNAITILVKRSRFDTLATNTITKRSGLVSHDVLQNILNGRDDQTEYFKINQKNLYEGEQYYIRLGVSKFDEVLKKIQEKSSRLLNVCEVYEGIQTGANEVFIFNELPSFYHSLSQEEKKFIKKFYKNSDITRYHINDTRKYILYFRNDINMDKYPSLSGYLRGYKSKLSSRAHIIRSRQPWYTLLWPRSSSLFSGTPKIVTSYRPKTNSFAYTEEPFYSGTDTYYIVNPKNNMSLKFVLGIINSKFSLIWLKNKGKLKGNVLEMTGDTIEQLLIPTLDNPVKEKQGQEIVNIVDLILKMTKSGDYLGDKKKQTQVEELEKQIDQKVYELYDLKDQERNIIEEETNRN